MTEAVPRRRGFLAVPGYVLAICLVLPTLRVCGNPVAPLAFPPAYAVYAGALVIGILALLHGVGARWIAMAVLLGMWLVTASALLTAGAASIHPAVGLITAAASLLAVVLAVQAVLRMAPTERGIAILCGIHGLIATGWYALLAFDRDALWGAYVGLGASVALLAAATMSLRDDTARRRASRPAPMPVARVIP